MDLLLTICLGLLAIILFGIAAPTITRVFILLGVIIALPFLWVAEKIERKWLDHRLKRDEKRAEALGIGNPYIYRSLRKRAKEDGISIEEYIEQNGTSIRGARW